jgi:hypothetical protein
MAKDKITNLGDIETMNIQRLLPRATTQDLSIRSSSDLREALKLAEEREKQEQKLKEKFDKNLENPMKKLNECINIMELVKSRISIATDSELLFLGDQYLKAYQNYQRAYAEVKTLNANASTMGYDPLPTNTTEKLSWLSTMRRIWREKKVKK